LKNSVFLDYHLENLFDQWFVKRVLPHLEPVETAPDNTSLMMSPRTATHLAHSDPRYNRAIRLGDVAALDGHRILINRHMPDKVVVSMREHHSVEFVINRPTTRLHQPGIVAIDVGLVTIAARDCCTVKNP
jgi:hypothetical protein